MEKTASNEDREVTCWSNRSCSRSPPETDLLQLRKRGGKIEDVFAGGIVLVGNSQHPGFDSLAGGCQKLAFFHATVDASHTQRFARNLDAFSFLELDFIHVAVGQKQGEAGKSGN